jgi:hypothetical protein
MTIRQIQATATLAGSDAYSTATTFTAGQILDIQPGSFWDTALGSNAPVLAGTELASVSTGCDPSVTDNS